LINLDSAIGEIDAELWPKVQGVREGLAGTAFGEVFMAPFPAGKESVEAIVDGA
jgi:hypothetical protein